MSTVETQVVPIENAARVRSDRTSDAGGNIEAREVQGALRDLDEAVTTAQQAADTARAEASNAAALALGLKQATQPPNALQIALTAQVFN